MHKVFIKIPGTERPYAVLGSPLFEDERFYAVSHNGIIRKILWENILYIEDLQTVMPVPDALTEKPQTSPPPVSLPDDTSVNVVFTGHKERAFKLGAVPKEYLNGDKWNPQLAKIIFSEPQIKAFMGDFIVSKIDVQGSNIYIQTQPTKHIPAPVESDSSETMAVPVLNQNGLQEKVNMLNKMVGGLDGKMARPKPAENTFTMTASPFEAPVSLKAPQSDE